MVFRLAGNAKMAFSGALKSTLRRKRYTVRTYGDAFNWLLTKYATHASMPNTYQDIIMMKQQDNEAPTAFGHRVETQCDLLNCLFNIQDVKDVTMTGLSDLVQAHVWVLNDRLPDRTLSETIATSQLYWDSTNKLRLKLKKTRPTAIKVTDATQDQRKTMERTLTPVRTPPPPMTASPQSSRVDICYSCKKPEHFAAQCDESYRPRERHQPPVGVHAIADGDAEDDATKDPAEDINASKNASAGCPTSGCPAGRESLQ